MRVQFEQLRSRARAENIAHPDRPDAARDARERDVFHVESAIEKERKARPELIDRDSARGEHFRVSKAVRERVGGLLHRRRSGLADVITADRDRIPARHFAGGELHHVGEKSERRLDRENRFVLRLDFLENVGLNRAAQFRNNFRTEAPFRGRDVHRHDDRRRTADRHRGGKIRRSEIESVVKPHHVFDGVDRDAALADLAENAVGIAVEPVKCRSIERRAEAMRALVAREKMEPLVRVFSEHRARRTGASALQVAYGLGFAPFCRARRVAPLPFFS